MLEHEPQQTPDVQIPAAQRRVSAEELTRAVSALEDAKAAERVAGVAPIGQVVDELGLDSTPEEIWAQVQRQRAEAVLKSQVKGVPAVQTQQIARHVRRGWRHSKGWLWVIFWCTGGFGLLAGLPHLLHPSPTVNIGGDGQTLTSGTLGKDVEVSGDKDTLTLQGTCPTLTVTGDGNYIRVEGTVKHVITDGDSNIVVYTQGPAPALSGNGDHNRIGRLTP